MWIGLVGVGRIGAAHAAALAGDPRVERLTVADTDRTRTAWAAEHLGAAVVGDVAALLSAGPDAVVVATSTASHADIVLRCCEAGIPVFCEKPVSSDVATTARVARRVRETGVAVQVGFQRRFDAGYLAARAALCAGELGELRRMHLVTADPAPPPDGYVANSGGIFRDCQIHDFDAVRWVSGHEVREVYATGSNRGEAYFAEAGDVDEAAAVLTLDDGTLATVQSSRHNGNGYDVRMELAGTRATVVAGLDTRVPLRSAEPDAPALRTPPWPGFVQRFAAAYRAEIAAFLTVVQTRSPSPCTVEDSLRALQVAVAAGQSRRERRPVPVDPPDA